MTIYSNWDIPARIDTKNIQKKNESRVFVLSLLNPHLFHGLLDNEPPVAWYGAIWWTALQGCSPGQTAYHTAHSLSSSFRGINAALLLAISWGCHISYPRMRTYCVVKRLYICEYINTCILPCFVVFVVYKLTFRTVEEVLCHCVVIWITLFYMLWLISYCESASRYFWDAYWLSLSLWKMSLPSGLRRSYAIFNAATVSSEFIRSENA